MFRSLLFVPGDRPDRFDKAAASGADAIILDLEDSVAFGSKPAAREAAAHWLGGKRETAALVRVNPLDGGLTAGDLAAILPVRPDGIMLPKAEGADSVRRLLEMMGSVRIPVLPIATETPGAVFELGTYAQCRADLLGLTWGAEDLSAAIGASRSREADGRFTHPYELARSLTLFGAHRAGVQAIETVYPDFRDVGGLEAFVQRARCDGFTGMMALHPGQIDAINRGFTPTAAEVSHARRIVELFDADPSLGVAQVDGRMVDRPHLVMARAILSRA